MGMFTDLVGLTLRGHYDLTDPAEIDSNQRGELTAKQRDWMQLIIRQSASGAAGSFLASALFGSFFLCFLLSVLNAYGLHQPAALVVPVIVGMVALAFLISALRGLLRIVRTRSELSRGKVEQADGQVVWQGGGYTARVAGRRLNPLDKRSNLLPGDYRFYYTPSSGWLLSAQKLFTFDEQHAGADLLNTLARTIGFSRATLEANRQGQVTSGQLLGALGSALTASWLPSLFIVVGVAVIVGMLLRGQMEGLVFVVFVVMGLYYLLRPWVTVIPDVLSGQIAVAEGVGSRFSYTSGSGTHGSARSTKYMYSIDHQSFRVSLSVYNALVEGVRYRLYYLPRSKRVLTIEPADARETQT